MVTAEAYASNRVPICAIVLVGRARVELATNGLKVSTDLNTEVTKRN